MGLYCTNCHNAVPEGVNQCRVCNNGFVHQLACSECGVLVIRGAAACGNMHTGEYARPDPQNSYGGLGSSAREHQGRVYPSRTELARVPLWRSDEGSMIHGETFDGVGRFGAVSDVTVPDGVANLMGEIGRTVQDLLTLARKLASVASTDRSRECIRGCRDLASRLQEELETRRGPGR